MNYELNESQKNLKKQMSEFCKAEIAPNASILDDNRSEAAGLLKSNMEKLGSVGYLGLVCGLIKPQNGKDGISQVIATEELAGCCASTYATAEVSAGLCGTAIDVFGTAAQKEKYLGDLLSGKKIGSCKAIYTADDTSVITATKQGDGWVLNGTATMMGNGPISDLVIILAQTGEDAGQQTAFIVEKNASGIAVGEPAAELGVKSFQVSSLTFDSCSLSAENLLGSEGKGAEILSLLKEQQDWGNTLALSGIGLASMREGVNYYKDGRKKLLTQVKSFKFADLWTITDVGRLLIYQAVWAKESGLRDASVLASCAGTFVQDAASRVAMAVLEMMGSDGYKSGCAAERFYRDVKFFGFAGKSAEKHRDDIAKDVLDQIAG
jgi:alkylation response protein AidB-like acyl-CoA dehydrogenase